MTDVFVTGGESNCEDTNLLQGAAPAGVQGNREVLVEASGLYESTSTYTLSKLLSQTHE